MESLHPDYDRRSLAAAAFHRQCSAERSSRHSSDHSYTAPCSHAQSDNTAAVTDTLCTSASRQTTETAHPAPPEIQICVRESLGVAQPHLLTPSAHSRAATPKTFAASVLWLQ